MANYNVSGLITLAKLANESKKKWYVYILQCADKTLYTGITNNLNKRISDHNKGLGAKYTKGRNPLHLVFKEQHSDRVSAAKKESKIKKLTKKEKLILIHNQ